MNMKPKQLSIGITSKCNSYCIYCDNKILKKDVHNEYEMIIRIIDDAVTLGVENVLLSGGEPLLHPDFFKICTYLKDIGMKYSIITNGCLLDYDKVEQLRNLECNYIGISFDSLSSNTFSRLRGVNSSSHEKLMDRIPNYRHYAGEMKLSLCCTLNKANIPELKDLYEYGDSVGIPVQFQPIHTNDYIEDEEMDYLWPNEADIQELERYIEYLKADSLDVDFLSKSVGYYRNGYNLKACYAPSAQVTIDQNLGLRPCWRYDPVEHIDDSNDLLEVWNSQKMKKFRELGESGECAGCLYSCHVNKPYNIE